MPLERNLEILNEKTWRPSHWTNTHILEPMEVVALVVGDIQGVWFRGRIAKHDLQWTLHVGGVSQNQDRRNSASANVPREIVPRSVRFYYNQIRLLI